MLKSHTATFKPDATFPRLELDGISVSLYRYAESGQVFVHVNTEDSLFDNDEDGNPTVCVTINDATLYDGDESEDGERSKTIGEHAIEKVIAAKTIESHRIFLYAGGEDYEDAFDVTDEEAVKWFKGLTDEESDRIYEQFKSEDYEAMDEINGVLQGLNLALSLVKS